MINPAKVLNFFDIVGTWDPSLAFVMGGALITTMIGYRIVFGRHHPIFASTFSIPTARDIDGKLIGGAAIFGIGWGIAGFCPGASIPAIGSLKPEVLVFTIAMIAGILVARRLKTSLTPNAKS
ncbi:UNVERIFIED_CONTAM: hypothetical protein GTU68_019640 [Idotea baltica]|nr:hypothetical protein [Idotea baltica]